MYRISIELVPRDLEALAHQMKKVHEEYPAINVVNFPDLLRYEIRSWEACQNARPYFSSAIPHLRAIDFNPLEPFPLSDYFEETGIKEVLVVTGDPPYEMTKRVYPTTSLDLIKKIKRQNPEVKVYAALDPYRGSMREEVELVKRKVDAGAEGFFTQPFFDLRLMDIFFELLQGQDVFWGVSPVTSEKSLLYWETKNNVVFPRDFQPTLEWNVAFARKALAHVQDIGQSFYFMPIRGDIHAYLQGIFSAS